AKGEKDPKDRAYFNGLQEAIKVLMNSFYGVFASSFYRFTDRDIGASITAYARANTKRVISELEGEGLNVIYGDTDSVFYTSPVENLEGAVDHGQEVSKKFTIEGATLEFEKVLNPFFSHGAKKRYVGRVLWPPGDDLVIRGYEVRRTDSFNLVSEAMVTIFNKLMDEDTDGAVEVAKDYVTRTQKGKIPLSDLVISRTVKDESDYKNPDSMTNVQARRKLEALGHEFSTGMKVSWVVVDSKKTPMEVEPFIDEESFKFKPDYEYYARRIALTLGRITEVFDWDEKALLTGSQQTSLFGFGQGGEDKVINVVTKKREKPKKEGRTLDDFF
ncbi:MAG TPA: DNA polymerase II, partial [Euryarchaeota archaeon]|nr:DNA polymerase II [Euryarchaeota archaeon]